MTCVLILIEGMYMFVVRAFNTDECATCIHVHGIIYRLPNDLSNSAHQFIENESDTKIFRIEK